MPDFARKLRQASFRGITFYVSSANDSTERRHVVHEYPQRDVPFVEDLGKGAQTFSLSVFVIGDACIQKAKSLREAVISGKPGTLIHPYEGSKRVFGTRAAFDFRTSELRIISGTLEFVEAGSLDHPAQLTDYFSWAKDLSQEISELGISEFVDAIQGNPIYGLVDQVLTGDVVGILDSLGASQLASVFGLVDSLGDLKNRAMYLIHNSPIDYASEFNDYLGLSKFSGDSGNWSSVPGMVGSITRSETMNTGTRRLAEERFGDGYVVGENTSLVNSNRAALETLARHTLLAQAVGASTLIGTGLDNISSGMGGFVSASDNESEEVTGASYDDVTASRDMILSLLDDELENPLTSDKMFNLLNDARSAVFSALTERAEGLSQLLTVKLPEVLPSVVVAYDYHDDAKREAELVQRNHVLNAGFCPIDLRVMSK